MDTPKKREEESFNLHGVKPLSADRRERIKEALMHVSSPLKKDSIRTKNKHFLSIAYPNHSVKFIVLFFIALILFAIVLYLVTQGYILIKW